MYQTTADRSKTPTQAVAWTWGIAVLLAVLMAGCQRMPSAEPASSASRFPSPRPGVVIDTSAYRGASSGRCTGSAFRLSTQMSLPRGWATLSVNGV